MHIGFFFLMNPIEWLGLTQDIVTIEYTVLDGIVTSHAFDGIVSLFISGRRFPFQMLDKWF